MENLDKIFKSKETGTEYIIGMYYVDEDKYMLRQKNNPYFGECIYNISGRDLKEKYESIEWYYCKN